MRARMTQIQENIRDRGFLGWRSLTRNPLLNSVFSYLEKSFRTSWFTAHVFRETVTAFVVCSVRVVTLTEHMHDE